MHKITFHQQANTFKANLLRIIICFISGITGFVTSLSLQCHFIWQKCHFKCHLAWQKCQNLYQKMKLCVINLKLF